MRWLRRLGRTLWRRRNDDDVTDELDLHVELEARELVAQGVPPADARRRALVALGGVERYREEAHDTRGFRWLLDSGRDAALTVRGLRRNPGFTAVVVITLALGIGANTAFFSILNSLVLRPLPVSNPDRIVIVDGEFTNPLWEQIRDRQSEFAEAAFAWSWAWDGFDLSDSGLKERVDGALVSGDFFRVLGVGAVRGRVLTPADDRRGGGADGPVAVISHRLWRDRFGSDAGVVGRSIRINQVPVTIVGVTPEEFFGLDVGRSFDVMLPLAVKPALDRDELALDRRTHWWAGIGARLKPGQTIEEAQAALRALQPAIRAATIPEDYPPEVAAEYFIEPLDILPAATGTSAVRSRYQPALAAIMVVAGLVLLIACANVANLLLARATTRRREIGLRLALGASHRRLAAQMLVESLILAVLGAAAGLLVAVWSSGAIVNQLSTWRNTVTLDLSLDWRVFAFTLVVTAVATMLFGLVPALSVRGGSPQQALRHAGRGTAGDSRPTARHALVVAQLALSLVLLVAAGLFLRTFAALNAAPTGMAIHSLLAVELDLRQSEMPADQHQPLIERMREAVATLPGVTSAAAASVTPLSGRAWNTAIGHGWPPSRDRMSFMNAVSPGWFDTVGARLIEGRDFTPADDDTRIIVNETFARAYLEDGPVTGQAVYMSGPSGVSSPLQVIGLTSDVAYQAPRGGMVPTIFVPAGTNAASSLAVRVAAGQHAYVSAAIPAALRQVDPTVSFTLRSFDELASGWVAQERLTAALSVAFGVLALLLAAVGLYGVMAYAVNRRRPEIAVRLALGAGRGSIVRLIVAQGGLLVSAGLLAGALLSWWGATFLESLLFQHQARDLPTIGIAALVLGATGLIAAWLPARRASRIEPAGLLREG